ncbi:MAG: hypothetical protein M1816_001338 [Peltula sp. TS41687]|nr:MAG: hypothetical protein M1816_001338 [Peltula sp. TS41687]
MNPPPQQQGPFYRVYDGLSQSWFSPEDGFLCGDTNVYWMRPELRFSRSAVLKHLDWSNREPTSYISVYSSPVTALRECRRRLANPDVYDRGLGGWVSRGMVRVTKISGPRTLRRNGVVLMSTAQLGRMGILTGSDTFAMGEEWLVLDWIPAACVEGDGGAGEFMQYCESLGVF